jgi:hypothetical protein
MGRSVAVCGGPRPGCGHVCWIALLAIPMDQVALPLQAVKATLNGWQGWGGAGLKLDLVLGGTASGAWCCSAVVELCYGLGGYARMRSEVKPRPSDACCVGNCCVGA